MGIRGAHASPKLTDRNLLYGYDCSGVVCHSIDVYVITVDAVGYRPDVSDSGIVVLCIWYYIHGGMSTDFEDDVSINVYMHACTYIFLFALKEFL